MSVRSAGRVLTNGRTDGHTHNVKTITPDTSQTWGVKKDKKKDNGSYIMVRKLYHGFKLQ